MLRRSAILLRHAARRPRRGEVGGIARSAGWSVWFAGALAVATAGGCGPDEPSRLETMSTANLEIKDQRFRVWIADEPAERERGLMSVTREEMAPLDDGTERGMLFVFRHDRITGFWMRGTVIPLDIAFIRADGTVVTLHTMTPHDERSYRPSGPYRYALEVNANVFVQLGVQRGDHIEIPPSVLKGVR
jgi:uncharacterized membrane protein (UPF0127 family)